MLKKTLLATAAIVLMSAPTMAADIVEAPVEVVSSWTAFYLGAGIGAAWSDFDTSGKYCDTYYDETVCYKEWNDDDYYGLNHLFGSDSDTSFRGIGQLGFDWEIAPSFVIGAFGDVNFGQQTGVSSKYYYYEDEHHKASYGVDALWTLGGRVGFGTENTLFYGLIGYSWADAEAKLGLFCEDGFGCDWTAKADDTVNGVTFGGGVEFKGWLWDTVSTSLEYRYTDLDSIGSKVWVNEFDYVKHSVDQDIQQINLVFKYRFGM